MSVKPCLIEMEVFWSPALASLQDWDVWSLAKLRICPKSIGFCYSKFHLSLLEFVQCYWLPLHISMDLSLNPWLFLHWLWDYLMDVSFQCWDQLVRFSKHCDLLLEIEKNWQFYSLWHLWSSWSISSHWMPSWTLFHSIDFWTSNSRWHFISFIGASQKIREKLEL